MVVLSCVKVKFLWAQAILFLVKPLPAETAPAQLPFLSKITLARIAATTYLRNQFGLGRSIERVSIGVSNLALDISRKIISTANRFSIKTKGRLFMHQPSFCPAFRLPARPFLRLPSAASAASAIAAASRIVPLAVLGLLALLPLHPAAHANMVTPGGIAVTESGAATYSIPIQVPPGIAGMEPRLELVYNSQGGNGLLGMGWSLSGLSHITRCPRTPAQDGVLIKGTVNFDADDRYCLDGQRLIKIAGAADGADGAEYRSERESFARITSHGVAGVGPAYFKVQTKAGQTIEFGLTADSRIEAQGKTSVAVWALNKITDTKGNYLAVAYTEDNANGEFYPLNINYTGNAAAGVTPTGAVTFQYKARPDITPIYHANSVARSTQRMSGITTWSKNPATLVPVKTYTLGYDSSPSSDRSRLVNVTECDPTLERCLPPTTFSWQGSAVSFTNMNVAAPITTNPFGYSDNTIGSAVGDFNGDGKSDILRWQNDYTQNAVFLASGNGKFTKVTAFNTVGNELAHSGKTVGYHFGDFNADGRTDILRWKDDTTQNAVYLANISGSFNKVSTFNLVNTSLGNSDAGVVTDSTYVDPNTGELINTTTTNYYGSILGDFNNDGRTDILRWCQDIPGLNELYLSNGDGSFTLTAFNIKDTAIGYHAFSSGTLWGSLLGDYNGDGKSDILYWNNYAANKLYLGNGDGSFTLSTAFNLVGIPLGMQGGGGGFLGGGVPDRSASALLGDYNGDGKTDILRRHDDPAQNLMYLSNGDGSFRQVATTLIAFGHSNGTYGSLLGDFNADGKTDILRWHDDFLQNALYLSNGNGRFTLAPSFNIKDTNLEHSNNTYGTYLGDFDGDGRTDILRRNDTFASNILYSGGPATDYPDLLYSVSDGIGATATFTYKPLTDIAVYTKFKNGNPALAVGHPEMDIQAPFYVVAQATTSNGIGGSSAATYTYGGAKANILNGRGFLGYQWVQSTQLETGITGRTDYRQDWPYLGLPSLTTKSLPNRTLSQTTYTYGCMDFVSASTSDCIVAPNRRYYNYVNLNLEQNWDLNGVAFPSTTTTNQFDSYGNATQVTVTTSDGYSKTTANTYTNDTTNWLLGRLTRATVTSTIPAAAAAGGPTSLTRTSAFAYDAASGLLTQEIIEPDIPDLRLQTDYAYNNFGNKTGITVSGVDFVSRTTATAYDPIWQGRFATSSSNALGHTETRNFDGRFGAITSLTGPNSLTTAWQYDLFGRKTSERRADGGYTVWSYLHCNGVSGGTITCPANSKYLVQTISLAADGVTQNGPISKAYFDSLNRKILTETQGFDGSLIREITEYDSLGRPARKSLPHYVGQTQLWAVPAYDALGRVISETSPEGSTTSIGYNGLTTTVTNHLGQTKTTLKNSQGQVVQVTEGQ